VECFRDSAKHGKVPILICDSYTRRILCEAAIWGVYFAHREQNIPPKYLGNKPEIAHIDFIIAPTISALNIKVDQTHRFPMRLA